MDLKDYIKEWHNISSNSSRSCVFQRNQIFKKILGVWVQFIWILLSIFSQIVNHMQNELNWYANQIQLEILFLGKVMLKTPFRIGYKSGNPYYSW